MENKFKIIEIFTKYKFNYKNEPLLFSDVINRVNAYLKKKPKQIFIFKFGIFLINPNDKEKRVIDIKNINTIKSIKNTSFMIVECKNGQDEILESFRKKEIMIFFKKLLSSNKKLKINFVNVYKSYYKNSKGDKVIFDPFINLKNINNYYQNLITYSKKIGNFKISVNKLLSKELTVIGILTNLGILCLNNINYKLENFIPLVGIKGIYHKRENLDIVIYYNKNLEKFWILFNSIIDKVEWVKEINNMASSFKNLKEIK